MGWMSKPPPPPPPTTMDFTAPALFGALLITAYLLRSKKGGSGPRCSLCFSESSEGVFWVQWTKEPVDGALAYFFPYKTPAEHYFTTNLGKRELGRGMGTPRNAKPGGEFYCCWVSFLKEAHKYSGPVTCARRRRRRRRRSPLARAAPYPAARPRRAAPTRPRSLAPRSFVANVEKLPVWIFLNKEGEVTRPSVGSTFSLKGISVAAVVPQLTSTEIVDVGQMAVKLFKDKCKKVGWTAHLESNVSAVQKLDTAKPVTLRRSSTYDDGTISLSTPEASPMR